MAANRSGGYLVEICSLHLTTAHLCGYSIEGFLAKVSTTRTTIIMTITTTSTTTTMITEKTATTTRRHVNPIQYLLGG